MGWFWILILVILGIGIVTKIVGSRFNKTNLYYSQVRSSANKTGAQVASEILARNNIRNVQVLIANKEGQDFYDPRSNHIMLSPSVYSSSSVSAVAIAAHEAGHAIQWGKQEIGIKVRDSIAKPVAFINKMTGAIFSIWFLLFLIMFSTSGYQTWLNWVIIAGVITYGSTSLFQLATLPVEFGASKKAKRQLDEMGYLKTSEEIDGTSKVLNAAAMTYVIAFLSSMVLFAVYLMILLSRRR